MYNNTNLPYKSLVHRYKSYPFLKFSNMNRCRIFISLQNSRIIISQLLLRPGKSFAALKWQLHRSPNQNMTKNALKIHKLKGSLKFRLRAAVEFFPGLLLLPSHLSSGVSDGFCLEVNVHPTGDRVG